MRDGIARRLVGSSVNQLLAISSYISVGVIRKSFISYIKLYQVLSVNQLSVISSYTTGVISREVISYISWDLITPAVRRITCRADIISARARRLPSCVSGLGGRRGNTLKVFKGFCMGKPRPKLGRDCLIRAIFARPRGR